MVTNESGNNVDMMNIVVNQLRKNKEKIIANFQELMGSPSLVVVISRQNQQTKFSILKQKLDKIHNEAISVDNCYEIIKFKNLIN